MYVRSTCEYVGAVILVRANDANSVILTILISRRNKVINSEPGVYMELKALKVKKVTLNVGNL